MPSPTRKLASTGTLEERVRRLEQALNFAEALFAVSAVGGDESAPFTGIGGGGSLVSARNAYGATTALAASASATLVTVVAAGNFHVRGFAVNGNADGLYEIRYNGTRKYARRGNISLPDPVLVLPDPDAVADGVTVTLVVTNLASDPGDFEGTLLGV